MVTNICPGRVLHHTEWWLLINNIPNNTCAAPSTHAHRANSPPARPQPRSPSPSRSSSSTTSSSSSDRHRRSHTRSHTHSHTRSRSRPRDAYYNRRRSRSRSRGDGHYSTRNDDDRYDQRRRDDRYEEHRYNRDDRHKYDDKYKYGDRHKNDDDRHKHDDKNKYDNDRYHRQRDERRHEEHRRDDRQDGRRYADERTSRHHDRRHGDRHRGHRDEPRYDDTRRNRDDDRRESKRRRYDDDYDDRHDNHRYEDRKRGMYFVCGGVLHVLQPPIITTTTITTAPSYSPPTPMDEDPHRPPAAPLHDDYARNESSNPPRRYDVASWDDYAAYAATSPPPLPPEDATSPTQQDAFPPGTIRPDARYTADDAASLHTRLAALYTSVFTLHQLPWAGLTPAQRVDGALKPLHLLVQKNDDVVLRWVMPEDAAMHRAHGVGLPRSKTAPEWLAANEYLPATQRAAAGAGGGGSTHGVCCGLVVGWVGFLWVVYGFYVWHGVLQLCTTSPTQEPMDGQVYVMEEDIGDPRAPPPVIPWDLADDGDATTSQADPRPHIVMPTARILPAPAFALYGPDPDAPAVLV